MDKIKKLKWSSSDPTEIDIINKLNEVIDAVNKLQEKPKEDTDRWKPEFDEEYWSISFDGKVDWFKWDGDWDGYDCYNLGNCFKTEEEAEQARELVRETLMKFHNGN